MPYVGKQPTVGNFVKLDAITTSATTTFALTNGGVAYYPQSPNHCLVSLNGILQAPTDSFTISGSNIVFSSALTVSDVIDFIIVLGDVLNIGTPSDNTVSLAKLTATGTKDSTTFLRGDNTFSVPSSDYVLLASQNITSAVSSVSFDGYFSSTYDNYRIVFYNYTPASNSQARLRLRRSNADVTTSNYSFARGLARTSGIDVETNNTDSTINIDSGNMNTGGSYNLNTVIDLFNPLGTDNYKTGVLLQSGYWDSANSIYDAGFTGFTLKDATTAISGITLYFSTGNVSRCKAKIYGIK